MVFYDRWWRVMLLLLLSEEDGSLRRMMLLVRRLAEVGSILTLMSVHLPSQTRQALLVLDSSHCSAIASLFNG